MRRLALILCLLVAAPATALVASAVGADKATYQVELDNAFGLVKGSEVRIGGVEGGGVITELDVNPEKKALITIEVGTEFGEFKADASCSSEPQSLIAEYFMDCQPGLKSEPLAVAPGAEYPTVPVEQTTTTVQSDLVNNTLREPFKRRLQLLINEFGTALFANSGELNAAIRRGAPALRELGAALKILGRQNTIIRDLNVNSDQIIARLTERREDVVRFIHEAEDTARISAERREDLARNFELLPDALAELRPTMIQLGLLAEESTPTLRNLRASAKRLVALSRNLPPFNRASAVSLDTLGDAGVVGRRALLRSRDEIAQLKAAAENMPVPTSELRKFLIDLDDPAKAPELNQKVPGDTGRTGPLGSSNAAGYTGLEGLLNYVYYQAGAINQFDSIGYNLHFTLNEIQVSPCHEFHVAPNYPTDTPDHTPTQNLAEAADCVAELGPNQPQVTQAIGLPPYSPEVCDDNRDEDGNSTGPVSFPAPGRADPICVPPSSSASSSASASSAATPQATQMPAIPGVPETPEADDQPQPDAQGNDGQGDAPLGGAGQGLPVPLPQQGEDATGGSIDIGGLIPGARTDDAAADDAAADNLLYFLLGP
jgi:phospholipid/cholesterol/gamma-HCH transport system substrate-binding protein